MIPPGGFRVIRSVQKRKRKRRKVASTGFRIDLPNLPQIARVQFTVPTPTVRVKAPPRYLIRPVAPPPAPTRPPIYGYVIYPTLCDIYPRIQLKTLRAVGIQIPPVLCDPISPIYPPKIYPGLILAPTFCGLPPQVDIPQDIYGPTISPAFCDIYPRIQLKILRATGLQIPPVLCDPINPIYSSKIYPGITFEPVFCEPPTIPTPVAPPPRNEVYGSTIYPVFCDIYPGIVLPQTHIEGFSIYPSLCEPMTPPPVPPPVDLPIYHGFALDPSFCPPLFMPDMPQDMHGWMETPILSDRGMGTPIPQTPVEGFPFPPTLGEMLPSMPTPPNEEGFMLSPTPLFTPGMPSDLPGWMETPVPPDSGMGTPIPQTPVEGFPVPPIAGNPIAPMPTPPNEEGFPLPPRSGNPIPSMPAPPNEEGFPIPPTLRGPVYPPPPDIPGFDLPPT